jgi:hypothetical protein
MRALSDPEIKRISRKDGQGSPCYWIFFATDFQGNFADDIGPPHAMVPWALSVSFRRSLATKDCDFQRRMIPRRAHWGLVIRSAHQEVMGVHLC